MTRRRSYLLRVRWLCPIQIRKWWLCFPGPPTGSGSCGILHRVLNPQGWTIGFSGWHELVLSHPPRFLSSRRCMKSSLVRGRHLLLPETAPVGPPPSPPLMAGRLRVTRASPLWSGPWLCSCALTPPGAGSRLSLPGPVSTRRTLPAGLTRPVGKPPPPYTLWRCCRSIRPRHWETCTRVVMTHKFITNFVLRRTSRFGRRRLRRGQWAVRCPLWWSRNAISGCVWPTWGFHVSILPRHRPFLRFAFEGRTYQYKVLPFGLALSPRVFTKVVEGALVPMREQGIRILNYLDDWLILAQSREQLCEHRDLVLSHLSQLGLQVNWEKSKLAPVQRISFLGMELDSVEQSARLTEERAQSVLNCLNTFRGRTAVPTVPTALAHQLPRVASSIPCPGPPEGAVTGQACAGPYGQYCDRCVHQPSRRSALPSYVATRPPSPPLESEASEVASRHSCPWCAQPCGRRALTSCAARRVATPPPGGPADLGGVRRGSGRPVCLARNLPLPVVLLPVRGDTRHRCTGAQLAPGPSQVCVSPSEPTCTDLVQSQGGRGAGLASCALLAQPDLVPGTHAPRDSPSLASSSEKGPSFSETGHPLAPASRPLETPCLVPGRDAEVLGDLPPEVLNTIASARALSTRRAYALKWNLFVRCSPEDVRSVSCFPFCSRAWSVGCLPPPSRFMLPLYPHTTTTSMVSRLVSTTWSSGSLGGQDG